MPANIANHTVDVSSGSVASLTSTSINVTAGNALYVACLFNANSSSTVTSNIQTLTPLSNSATPGGFAYKTFYVNNATGGSTTVTLTPFSSHICAIIVVEIGNVLVSAFDVSNSSNNTPATTTPTSGNTVALSQADSLAIGVLLSDSAANPATATQGSGYTLLDSSLNGTNLVVASEYQILSATTPIAATWTTDNVTSAVEVAVFKAGAGGGGGATLWAQSVL